MSQQGTQVPGRQTGFESWLCLFTSCVTSQGLPGLLEQSIKCVCVGGEAILKQVLEARSPKSMCQQGRFFLEAKRENPLMPLSRRLALVGDARRSLACSRIPPISASVCSLRVPL